VDDDRNPNDPDAMLDPEDVNSAPTQASLKEDGGAAATSQDGASQASADPNDEIPVPIAMSAAEIDERAQAVEAMRGTDATQPADNQPTGA
jgi:hypothetical protein